MNDRVIEADDTAAASPDDWAYEPPKAVPLSVSDELQRQVDEFLAQGGTIQEFEPGETAVPINQPLWSFPVGKAAAPSPIKRIQAQARRKAIQAVRGDQRSDAELVAELDPLLGTAKTTKELHTTIGCSCNLLQRLLHMYYPNDSRADRYRAKNRIDHAMEQAAQIRALLKEGQAGIANIARLMNTDRKRVLQLDREYGLKIPRDEVGKRAGSTVPATKRVYKGKHVCTNKGCGARLTGQTQYCPHCGQITARGLEKRAER